jgi:hypothetical protein
MHYPAALGVAIAQTFYAISENHERSVLKQLLGQIKLVGVLIQADVLHTSPPFFSSSRSREADLLMQGVCHFSLMHSWHPLEQVACKEHPAALRSVACHHSSYRFNEALLVIALHELDSSRSRSLSEPIKLIAAESLALAHLAAEHSPEVISIVAHGHGVGSRAGLHYSTQLFVEVTRGRKKVRRTRCRQRRAEICLQLTDDLGTDPSYLGF